MNKLSPLLAASLFLASSPLLAKDYIVELLIFKHNTGTAGISWQPGVLLPKEPRGLSIFGNDTAEGYIPMDLGPALAETAETLARSDRYPMITYRTWQQPGLAREEVEEIRINVGQIVDVFDSGEEAPRAQAQFQVGDDYLDYTLASMDPSFGGVQRRTFALNGAVTVSLGRYLHLYTDLVYTDLNTGQSTLQKSHRRMRSKRSHYIDNPVFGIIAHITPVEEPTEDETNSLDAQAIPTAVDGDN